MKISNTWGITKVFRQSSRQIFKGWFECSFPKYHPELEPVRFFQTGPDRPVQTPDLTGKKPVKNRPVTILDFTGVKPMHFMHQLNNQYFRETVF